MTQTGMSKKLTIGILIIQTIAHMAQDATNKLPYAGMVCVLGAFFMAGNIIRDCMLGREKEE